MYYSLNDIILNGGGAGIATWYRKIKILFIQLTFTILSRILFDCVQSVSKHQQTIVDVVIIMLNKLPQIVIQGD